MSFAGHFHYHCSTEFIFGYTRKSRYKALQHICPNLAELLNLGDDFVSEVIDDIITDIAPSFEDTVVKCKWKNRNVSPASLFVPVLTPVGLCFSFNAVNSQEIYTDE